MRLIILILLASCAWRPATGQNLDVGVLLGGSTYEGEVAPAEILDYLKTYRPAVGFFARYNFTDNLALRSDLRYATIFGDDAISDRSRNFNFRTRLAEWTILGEWAPFSLHLGRGTSVQPFGQVGGGLLYFQPQGLRNNEYFDLQPLGTEGQGLPGYPQPYTPFTYVLTGGGGLKINFNETWGLSVEGALRYAGSDYLDDISTTPVTYRDVLDGNGSLAAYFSRPNFDLDADNPDASYVRGGAATDFIFMAVATFYVRLGKGNRLRIGRRDQLGCPTNF